MADEYYTNTHCCTLFLLRASLSTRKTYPIKYVHCRHKSAYAMSLVIIGYELYTLQNVRCLR